MHPSFKRWHSNCLNLTIQCGIATKVSGLGITRCIHSRGYFCTTRKGNHIRVALLAHKSFQCKRALCSWGSTVLRCGTGHREIQLLDMDGRALEKSFCSFCLTLACNTGCNTSVHGQQAWRCLWLHWAWVGPEPFRQALGGMGSFRADVAEGFRHPLKMLRPEGEMLWSRVLIIPRWSSRRAAC